MGFNNWNLSNSRFQQEGGFDPVHCVVMHEISQNHPSVNQGVSSFTPGTGNPLRLAKPAQEGVSTDRRDMTEILLKAA